MKTPQVAALPGMTPLGFPQTVTAQELAEKLGRQPSVNEWRVANGKEPIKKVGRKVRKGRG
jgi:hypothetical protein